MDHPPALPLDAPLPAEIAGRTQGWLTHYRRYPVFSPAWARGRAVGVGGPALAVTALLLSGALVGSPVAEVPWGPMLQVCLWVLVPVFAGPWLGSLVRRRGLAPRVEFWGLVAAVAGLVLALAAFNEWLGEPVKQQIAEWAGQVDEQGQRKRIALMIGVTVRPADAPASAASRELPQRPNLRPTVTTHVASAALAFALAGGFALPRLRREREGLAALARERELARAQAERREAEMRLSVLAAQVEPHFLFNTLAGVRSAINGDPARAALLVDRLVDYLRATIPRLRADGGAEATLGHQIEAVRAYLALMSARLPRLAFAIDLPPALAALPFPPLMLISLAENAVKHGIEPKIGPARIEVGARRLDDGRLEVTVADDGVGFGGATAGGGIGLANIRERLRQMHGERAALALKARPEGGVAARITVPVEPLP